MFRTQRQLAEMFSRTLKLSIIVSFSAIENLLVIDSGVLDAIAAGNLTFSVELSLWKMLASTALGGESEIRSVDEASTFLVIGLICAFLN